MLTPVFVRNRALDMAVALVLLIGFLCVPAWADNGLIFLACLVMVNIVFAVGFNLAFGLTGLLSFGHAAFFACGAYTTGFLIQNYGGAPFLLSWLAAGVAGGIAAAIVGVVALRRSSGIYFATLTLALAELVHVLISKSTVLGRDDGLTGIKRPVIDLGVFRIDLAAGNTLYYFTLAVCAILIALLYVLWHNRTGRLLSAMRQDADRVRFLGIDVHRTRFLAFIVSGVFVGLAGGLYAPIAQILTPEIAKWSFSALPILYCLIGGVLYFWGPVVGAIIFMGLEHATRNVAGLSELIVGVVLLLVVLVFPGGLIGGIARLRQLAARKAPSATP